MTTAQLSILDPQRREVPTIRTVITSADASEVLTMPRSTASRSGSCKAHLARLRFKLSIQNIRLRIVQDIGQPRIGRCHLLGRYRREQAYKNRATKRGMNVAPSLWIRTDICVGGPCARDLTRANRAVPQSQDVGRINRKLESDLLRHHYPYGKQRIERPPRVGHKPVAKSMHCAMARGL